MQRNIIIILLFAIVIAVFAIQNASPVLITFFSWNYQVSLVVVVLGATALGTIIMGLVASFSQLRLRRELRTLNREKEALRQTYQDLKKQVKELERAKESEQEISDLATTDQLKEED